MSDSVSEKEAPPEYTTDAVPEVFDLLTGMLDQLSEGVMTLAEDGTVVAWNPRAAHLTGYTLAQINAQGLTSLFNNPEEIQQLLQRSRGEAVTLEARLLLTRADGQRLPVDMRCSPLRHLGQTAGRTVLVLRDLSELEALQNRLLQSERLNILGRLAGAVSHEIRNPLTAIFLQTDILEDELQQPDGGNREQLLRSLTVIKEEVSHVHDLVQQYLSLARLSDLRRSPVDLQAYLEAFSEATRERLQGRGITLQSQWGGTRAQVALDQKSFRRVLLNLVNNALEAMPEGGSLCLRLQPAETTVRLEVSDTGHGIQPEQVPMLFHPFYSTKPEGTGLGLYLVHEIITAHQGDITVHSVPGEGTTFVVTLPLYMGTGTIAGGQTQEG